MANLTRYSPFDEAFDDFFKGFFVRPVAFDEKAPRQLGMRIDVTEGEKAYVVHADLPGVKKEDIQITVDGDQVAISAEVKSQREQRDGEKLIRSERTHGKAYRAFTLAQDIDEAQAEAKYADGVLELTLPKKAAASAKRLSVQ